MAVHVVVMTVVIGGIVAQSNHLLTARLNSGFNHDLSEEPPEFSNAAADRPRGQSLQDFARLYLATHLRLSGQSLIIALDEAGGTPAKPARVVLWSAHAGSVASSPLVASQLATPRPTPKLADLTMAGSRYRMFAGPISVSGRRVGVLVVVRSLASLSADRGSELTIAALEGLAALVAAVVAGYLLLRGVLRVVSDVTDAAENAASGNLSQHLETGGRDDEVGRLARTVNTMLERLDQAFSSQRRLLSDVSHQLRTPLTVIRGHLEVLARRPDADAEERSETIALVVDELEHMSLMVERLLLLGRALEPDFIEEEPIDTQALLEDVVDAAQHLAPRNWEVDPGPQLVVRGDRTKLRGALLNLIDNAVAATAEDDTIGVSAARDASGELTLEVADTGRGLSAADQKRLFERFTRSTDRYRGTGLGLAIVKAVAEAHGGRVAIESELGEGCRVRIILPPERVASAEKQPAVV